VLRCVAVCCSVMQCVTARVVSAVGDFVAQVCCGVLHCDAVCCGVLRCVAVCCSVLQCEAVCCSVLQYVAMCCSAKIAIARRGPPILTPYTHLE